MVVAFALTAAPAGPP